MYKALGLRSFWEMSTQTRVKCLGFLIQIPSSPTERTCACLPANQVSKLSSGNQSRVGHSRAGTEIALLPPGPGLSLGVVLAS